MTSVEVPTSAGRVRGLREGPSVVFRGIPFAAPPVGPHRFAAPVPAAPCDGVRAALRPGPAPPRPGHPTTGDDWLTLTVWTPDPGRAALPVIVWISGGGYLACDSADPFLQGDLLAAAGAVVVSVHYRTGCEGFLHVDGAPDNRALLDQLAALRWVHGEIAAFGGDPDSVTVLGQSAGAGSIAALLAMPAAAGAFRRAILQSVPGTYFSPALAADVAVAVCAGLDRTRLADVDPDVLVAATAAVTDGLVHRADDWGAVAWSSTPFSPVVDGEVLPQAPWPALAAGAARDVDLLVAHTRDEYRLLAAHLPDTDDDGVDALVGRLDPTPGAARYREAFPASEVRETALADWLHRMPALHLAEAADRGGARVRLAELRWGFGPDGASHGLDTLLLFGSADLRGEVTAAGPAALDEAARLGRTLRAEYLAFAATGDPGWPRFDRLARRTRVHDAQPGVLAYPEEASRRIWRDRRFGVLDLPDRPGLTRRRRGAPPAPASPRRGPGAARRRDG
ncbi:carboxylesterase family protein [Pseudonocardia petroleophila]|uniref:Carboxylic ester hydrolase n=1 Tax=Pseudonocardia petroleophila TaxID=37331 RepID=A0A7G7MEI0_9PSEU|nr:carboxylesterase family protein [Pseudonocardia petroleophila]QNG51191.1 carboxylesterase family protein [Pseudonocardia petroleophila]